MLSNADIAERDIMVCKLHGSALYSTKMCLVSKRYMTLWNRLSTSRCINFVFCGDEQSKSEYPIAVELLRGGGSKCFNMLLPHSVNSYAVNSTSLAHFVLYFVKYLKPKLIDVIPGKLLY